jgi:hypothetical protein
MKKNGANSLVTRPTLHTGFWVNQMASLPLVGRRFSLRERTTRGAGKDRRGDEHGGLRIRGRHLQLRRRSRGPTRVQRERRSVPGVRPGDPGGRRFIVELAFTDTDSNRPSAWRGAPLHYPYPYPYHHLPVGSGVNRIGREIPVLVAGSGLPARAPAGKPHESGHQQRQLGPEAASAGGWCVAVAPVTNGLNDALLACPLRPTGRTFDSAVAVGYVKISFIMFVGASPCGLTPVTPRRVSPRHLQRKQHRYRQRQDKEEPRCSPVHRVSPRLQSDSCTARDQLSWQNHSQLSNRHRAVATHRNRATGSENRSRRCGTRSRVTMTISAGLAEPPMARCSWRSDLLGGSQLAGSPRARRETPGFGRDSRSRHRAFPRGTVGTRHETVSRRCSSPRRPTRLARGRARDRCRLSTRFRSRVRLPRPGPR